MALVASLAISSPAEAARKKKQDDPRAQTDALLRPLIDKHLAIAHQLTAGLLAWDAQDWGAAATHWEALLTVKDLPEDVAAAVRPLAEEARKKAGGSAAPAGDEPVVEATPAPDKPAEEEPPPDKPKRPSTQVVTGTVSGGGPGGPGGAVVQLRRADGKTPRPTPLLGKTLVQKDKRFQPHVLAVPVGSRVVFRNRDDIFHNVFSISPVRAFDTGLRKAGDSDAVVFDKPGAIELLCNIHASMGGWLVVVDTPWYAVADGGGAFRIKNVPPGEYDAEVWHENASSSTRTRVTVGEESAPLSLAAGGDKRANPFPPDKYGKPRQQQLGY